MTKKSKAEICEFVHQFKKACAVHGLIEADGALDLPRIYENLPSLWGGWDFVVKEHDEMGEYLGTTNPRKKLISLRNDVYEGLCNGDKEHQYTAAHELGHMVLHSEMEFARREGGANRSMSDVEDEADDFATVLLGFDSPANESAIAQVIELIERLQGKSSSL